MWAIMAVAMSMPVHSVMFLRWALELTSMTTGPSEPLRMSTPQKSASKASAAATASSDSSRVGSCGCMVPPRVALARNSPGFAFLRTAATASPPTTSILRSSPPHSTYSWRIIGRSPVTRASSSVTSWARRTCWPKDPKQSLTTIGNPRVRTASMRNPLSVYPTPSKVFGHGIVLRLGTPALARARCVLALSSQSMMHCAELNSLSPAASSDMARVTSLSQNTTKSASRGRSPMGAQRSQLRTTSSSMPSPLAAADIIAAGSSNFPPARNPLTTMAPRMGTLPTCRYTILPSGIS